MITQHKTTAEQLKALNIKSNKGKYYNNLTKGEITELKELADRNDIIITIADKGEAVHIIGVEDYVKEAEHQLNNKGANKKLQYYSTYKNWSITQ